MQFLVNQVLMMVQTFKLISPKSVSILFKALAAIIA